jgi:hypothetical protein
MPLTPLAGSTRLRAFQLGLEGTPLTQTAATRRMPWSFAPTVDPHWTFPTADTGTLAQAIAPYRLALDVTGVATGQLFADDVPGLMGPSIQGGISPSTVGGTGKSWAWQPATTSQDVFDTVTAEWFDDATADAWTGVGGVCTGWTLTYPQNLGPIELSSNWRLASVVYPATPPRPRHRPRADAALHGRHRALHQRHGREAASRTPCTTPRSATRATST